MELFRVCIVEDSAAAREKLRAFLAVYEEEHDCRFSVSEFADPLDFLEKFRNNFDFIFLDIDLPYMDGMEIARRIRATDKQAIVIFVTNMVQYAVKGYEVEALDFIVKPVRYPSFEMKMRRILQAVDLKKGREVLLSVGGTVRVLTSSSIYYVEVMDHDLTYHTSQGDVTVRGRLSAVEQQLPREVFFRCSTSYLINLQHVRQLTGDTVLVGDRELRVSRGRKKELMAALAACLGRGV